MQALADIRQLLPGHLAGEIRAVFSFRQSRRCSMIPGSAQFPCSVFSGQAGTVAAAFRMNEIDLRSSYVRLTPVSPPSNVLIR
jgi:hypothetical protein